MFIHLWNDPLPPSRVLSTSLLSSLGASWEEHPWKVNRGGGGTGCHELNLGHKKIFKCSDLLLKKGLPWLTWSLMLCGLLRSYRRWAFSRLILKRSFLTICLWQLAQKNLSLFFLLHTSWYTLFILYRHTSSGRQSPSAIPEDFCWNVSQYAERIR